MIAERRVKLLEMMEHFKDKKKPEDKRRMYLEVIRWLIRVYGNKDQQVVPFVIPDLQKLV